jgi:hypothetical protein
MSNIPSQPEYSRLASLAYDDKVTFRVWDKHSSTPLRISHEPSLSGFTAPHRVFARMDQKAYKCLIDDTEGDYAWMDSEIICEITLKHLLGTRTVNGNLAELWDTPWISTTGCLRWVVWEVARRLAIDPKATVHMTVVDKRLTSPSICTKALHRVRACQDGVKEDVDLQEKRRMEQAMDKIRGSGEELWYGRIFGEAIEKDLIWTASVSPILRCSSFFALSIPR